MARKMSKLETLENGRFKIEGELDALSKKQKDLNLQIARKKKDLEAANSAYIAEILVSNKISMSEFLKQMPEMIGLMQPISHKIDFETQQSGIPEFSEGVE
jgi:hypothetical protein